MKQMEKWAPQHLAYNWDNVGLQIGSKNDETKKVMVTLDVVESVVDEAISKDVNLIIAHHPLLFKPLQQINFDTFKGKVIKKLIEHNITVYAAHTNLDIAHGGVNDLLSDALQLTNKTHLVTTYKEKLFKLMVYVPKTHADSLRQALGDEGFGYIGQYSHCSFNTEGTGTFMPREGSDPFIGSEDKVAFVEELKIETLIQEKDIQRALQTVHKHHPYEEVAYDLYPLSQHGEQFGIGAIGSLENSTTLDELSEKVKEAFQLDAVRVTGPSNLTVQKVAILGGSGEKFIQQAIQKGADVFITGDMTFHQAQDANEMGLSVIDAGHYIEEIMKQATKDYLENTSTEVDYIVSTVNTNPFRYV